MTERGAPTSIAARLAALGAHHDLVSWAGPFDDDVVRFWEACPRGDWLLAVAARLGAEARSLVRAAMDCAVLALDHLPDEAVAPRDALALAARYADGAARDELDDEASAIVATLEGDIERATDPAAQAATAAILAVLRVLSSTEHAPLVVANAAQAAVFDAGECAMMAAIRYVHAESAERVRRVIDAAWAREAFDRLDGFGTSGASDGSGASGGSGAAQGA